MIGTGEATRNSLINEPVVTLDDRNPDRTDILHEYFVSFDAFDSFLEAGREVIPASYQEFLNVTLRYIAQNDQSALSYATSPRIAAVMSFSQEMTQRAEADMRRMTEALIDRIAADGGADLSQGGADVYGAVWARLFGRRDFRVFHRLRLS